MPGLVPLAVSVPGRQADELPASRAGRESQELEPAKASLAPLKSEDPQVLDMFSIVQLC